MTIRILGLPGKDLQYALYCMEIDELIAFSLCSNRTKNLVKSSNREIEPIYAYVYLNSIIFEIRPSDQEFLYPPLQSITFSIRPGSQITLEREYEIGFEVWRKQEFTQSDWIPHFLDIFHESMIQGLRIVNVDKSYLDTVKRIIPKFNRLEISDKCSNDVVKKAFFEFSPVAVQKVGVQKNIFDNDTDVFQFLTLNLKSVFFTDWETPLKLNLSDLLVANINTLSIVTTNIFEKELNRFVKLWMKSNHRFYRPEHIDLSFRNEINRAEVLRGIKHQTVDNSYLLKRADGKELKISVIMRSVVFEFQ